MKSEIRIMKEKNWKWPGNYGTWSRGVNYTTEKAVEFVVKTFKQQGIIPVVTETEDAFLIAA